MRTTDTTPVTVLLRPGDRERLDAMARKNGTTRSEILRGIVAEALDREPEAIVSSRGHRVTFDLPVVADDADLDRKESAAVRNATVLAGQCPVCHVRAELGDDELPTRSTTDGGPLRVATSSVKLVASEGSHHGTTVSTISEEDGSLTRRLSIPAKFCHESYCPAH